MYIYADVVLGINLVMNSLILIFTAQAAGVCFKLWRVLLAAMIGSLYSLGELVPNLLVLYHPIAKIVFSILLVLIAYQIKSVKKLAFLVGIFYLVSCILGGAVIGWLFFCQEGYNLGGPVSWKGLMGGGLLGVFLLVTVAKAIINNLERKKLCYPVVIELFGRCVHLQGMIDTGNSLYSLVGKKPVVLVTYEAIKVILSLDTIEYLSTTEPTMWLHCLDQCQDSQWLSRVQLIPYQAIGNQSILLGFRPDKLCTVIDHQLVESDAIIGLSTSQLSLANNCEVLLHPKVLVGCKNNREVTVCA